MGCSPSKCPTLLYRYLCCKNCTFFTLQRQFRKQCGTDSDAEEPSDSDEDCDCEADNDEEQLQPTRKRKVTHERQQICETCGAPTNTQFCRDCADPYDDSATVPSSQNAISCDKRVSYSVPELVTLIHLVTLDNTDTYLESETLGTYDIVHTHTP